MYRNIILFSDGTGNSSAKLFRTNVWRVYQAVDLTDPKDPTQPRQFAFYDNGVGTSSFKPLAALGGALGVGLARNVRDLYAFVCRTYQPGDKIYAFGFSRGAFTIRVLVGLMMDQGLVPYDGNEADLERHVAAAYREYRKKCHTKLKSGLVFLMRGLRDLFSYARDRLLRKPLYRDINKIGAPGSQAPLEIKFLGLWDTVDAYGLPVDELTRAIDSAFWPLTMRDLNLNQRVNWARHALALDDERNTFHPRPWNEEPQDGDPEVGVPGGNKNTKHIDNERISQVWFAGVHSNVGGGYPDDSLSHVPLEWIMNEANKPRMEDGQSVPGLRFSQKIWDAFRALADENGPIYDSRHGLAGYYRYNPRRIEKLTNTKEVTIKRCKIHESVLRRIKVGQDGYAPFVLPPGFAVMRFDGSITDGANYLQTGIDEKSQWVKQREHVWNWVWWRRIAYFGTLFATLALIAMPLLKPALPKGACSSKVCFLSDVIDSVAAAVLPGFMATWTDSFSSHPDVFLVLAALIWLGLWAGGVFEGYVRDAMRPIWYGIPKTSPRTISPPLPPAILNRAVQWLRTRKPYQWSFWFLTQRVLPGAFVIVVAYAAIAFVSQVTFAARDSWGQVCASAGNLKPVPLREEGRPFRTSALCTSTGLTVEKGATYRLHITIPAGDPWTDNGHPAGPNGVLPDDVSFPMTTGVLLRRHLGQPWLKPMAKIGVIGSDEYPLDPVPSLALDDFPRKNVPNQSPHDKTFATEIVVRSTGELFLYLNDAILLPPTTEWFYSNNEGSGRVTVERVAPPPL
jgi:uncharacterized protein (DUF2235 family)